MLQGMWSHAIWMRQTLNEKSSIWKSRKEAANGCGAKFQNLWTLRLGFFFSSAFPFCTLSSNSSTSVLRSRFLGGGIKKCERQWSHMQICTTWEPRTENKQEQGIIWNIPLHSAHAPQNKRHRAEKEQPTRSNKPYRKVSILTVWLSMSGCILVIPRLHAPGLQGFLKNLKSLF